MFEELKYLTLYIMLSRHILFLFLFNYFWPLCLCFDPYQDNSGSVVGLRGSNYALLASDSRLSEHHNIQTRNFTRIFPMRQKMMFAGTGCLADILELWQDLKHFEHSYCFANEGKLFLEAAGFYLSKRFYSRRNFPFYSFCGLAGIDEDGRACLLRYDALGSYESVDAFCCGQGEKLMQPILDSLVNPGKNPSSWGHDAEAGVFVSKHAFISQNYVKDSMETSMYTDTGNKMMYKESKFGIAAMTKEEAVDQVVNAFESAANRDTTIGDGLHMWVMEGICEDTCFQTSSITSPLESEFKPRRYVRLHKYFYQLSRS